MRRLLLLLAVLPALAQEENRAFLGVVAVEGEQGVVVADVIAKSPAALAGMAKGDVLLSIGGKDIRRARDVDAALSGGKPGDEVAVAYRRGEGRAEARARLAARPRPDTPRKRGATGFEAPAWHAYAWANVKKDEAPTPESTKGKVVVIHAFQSWCPGCARWGFPVMKQVEEELKGADDVVLFHLQTVFEGASENTPERAAKEIAKYKIAVPYGYDARVDGAGESLLMERYGTDGTPWTVVIDRKGVVRFNAFTPADSKTLVALVQELRK
ncbi:MAG: PDZ domain-containing protein [Planctomycetota bacterium]